MILESTKIKKRQEENDEKFKEIHGTNNAQ
jgi:hypothetical protein